VGHTNLEGLGTGWDADEGAEDASSRIRCEEEMKVGFQPSLAPVATPVCQ
jgi:hypothetical protein